MAQRALFNVFPKKLESGNVIYYYTAYDIFGKRHQFSTGKSKKREAITFCLNKFKYDNLIAPQLPNFEKYTKDWFVYEKCSYIQGKLLRGFTYSQSNALNNRGLLLLHIVPYFKNLKISDITLIHVEEWLLLLKKYKHLSNISLNYCLSLLKIILNEAERIGDIDSNPAKSFQMLAVESREKGILTQKECKKLFDQDTLKTIWQGQELHYLLNLTASLTGMRLGELQALKMENVYQDHIHVKHSWDRRFGIKCTKTGKPRDIPISKDLYSKLRNLYMKTSLKGLYIFSVDGGKQPVDHKAIYKWYGRSFSNIGLTKDIRKKRNITFHSWRHYLNSILRLKGVPDSVIKMLTGHRTQDMMEHYTHFELEELKKILSCLIGNGI